MLNLGTSLGRYQVIVFPSFEDMRTFRNPVAEVSVLDQFRRSKLTTAFNVDFACVNTDWVALVVFGSFTEWLGQR